MVPAAPIRKTRYLLLTVLLCLLFVGTLSASGALQLNRIGVALMGEGKVDEALDVFHRALDADPSETVIRRNLAECYFGVASSRMEAGRYTEAAEAFAAGLRYAEDEPRFMTYLGYALMMQGEYVRAESELEGALAVGGDDPLALRLLGQLHYDTGRLFEAIGSWERARKLAPNDAEIGSLLEKARREARVEEGMTSDYGTNFIISYDDDAHGRVGSLILEVLEGAYNEVGYWLDFYPDVQIPVLLYTRRDFDDLTGSPEWAGGLYDGKIRIPIGGGTAMSPELRALLYHEYSHVAVRYLSRGRCPFWLNEGLAEFAGRSQNASPLDRLRDALEGGGQFPLGRLQGPLGDLTREKVVLAYQQSYTLARHLVERYGWHKVRRILDELGGGATTEDAVVTALGEYGLDLSALEAEWLSMVGEQL